MSSNTNYLPPYPPVAVALALAVRSHALPGSAPTAPARLALVTRLAERKQWSEATWAALAMRQIDWDALARHLDETPEHLQRLDPVALLARFDRRPRPSL